MNKYQWFVFAIVFFISSVWFSNFFINVYPYTQDVVLEKTRIMEDSVSMTLVYSRIQFSLMLGTILGGVFSALSIAFGICGGIELLKERKKK